MRMTTLLVLLASLWGAHIAYSATTNWDFNSPLSYGVSNGSALEVAGGNAHLTEVASPTWYDNEYIYRTRIRVAASATDALPMQFTTSIYKDLAALVASGKLRADGADLRLVYWNATANRYERFNGTTWEEDAAKVGMDVIFEPSTGGNFPNDANMRIWFALAKALTTNEVDSNYFLYYGNATENTLPSQNGNLVFQFYDSFDGSTLDNSLWDLSMAGSAFSVSNGEVRSTSSNNRIKSVKTFTYPVRLETEFISYTTPTNGIQSIGFWSSTSDGIGLLTHSTTDYIRNNSSWPNLGFKHADNQAHYMDLAAISNSQVRFYTKNLATSATVMNNLVYSNVVQSESITLGLRYDNSLYGQAADSRWRYVRVRTYVGNEPSVSLLTEQPHYSTLAPYVYPYVGTDALDRMVSFSATTSEPQGTGVRFCVSNDNGNTWKFFDVNQWTNSDCSYSQASNVNDINENISGLGVGTFLFRALLYSQTGIVSPSIDQVTLKANDIPNAFLLATPTTGTERNSLTGSLTWNYSQDTDAEDASLDYRIQMDDDPSFTTPVINKSLGNSNNYTVIGGDALQDNTTYYWRVIAKDSYQDSVISNVNVLHINLAPQLPSITSVSIPIGTEVTGASYLSWTATDPDPNETLTYEIMVDNSSAFTSPEKSQTNLIQPSVLISSLTGTGTLTDDVIYYWKVRAKDKTGNYSPYSSALNTFFYNPTNDAPTTPVLSTPLNLEVAIPTTSFTFTTTDPDSKGLTPDTHTFIVEISTNSGFTSIIGTTVGASSGVLLNQLNGYSSLTNGTTYYWRVKATDNHGLSSTSFSSSRRFLFQYSNTAPTATYFANVPNDSIYRLTSLVEWLPSSDADLGNTIKYVIEAKSDTLNVAFDLTDTITGAAVTSASLSTIISGNTTGSKIASTFDNKRYFVRIRAIDNTGYSSANSNWRQVKWNMVALATVDLTSGTTVPLNNSLVVTTQPFMNWDDLATTGGSAEAYTFEYAQVKSMSGASREKLTVSQYDFASEGVHLSDNAKYYWRVWAHDLFGDSTVSVTDSFYIDQANEDPTTPNSFSIVDGVERTLSDSIGWSASDPDPIDQLTFDIQIDDNSNFLSPEISSIGFSLTKMQLTDLAGSENLVDNTKYYYKVKSCDSHNSCSPYSPATRYFIFNPINNAPETPDNVLPTDGAILTPNDALSFTAIDADNQGITPDVLSFTIEISQNVGFSSVISTTLGASSGIKVGELNNAVSLVNGVTYYWRVASRDPHGATSSPTTARSFLYQSTNSPPTSTSFQSIPVDSLYRLSDEFTWTVSTDADAGNTVEYILEMDTDTLSLSRELTVRTAATHLSLENAIANNSTGSQVASDFDNQRIFIRIRAVDNTNFASSFSAWKKVKLNTVILGTVDLSDAQTSPQGNSTVQTLQPVLDWVEPLANGGVPERYTVELSAHALFSSPIRKSVTNSQISLSDHAIVYVDNTVQYWRVWSHDSFGDSTQSLVDSFVVNLFNETPTLSATLSIPDATERSSADSLGWVASDADPHSVLAYELKIDDDAGFNSPEISQSSISLSKIRILDLTGVGSLIDNTPYFWKVRVCDELLVCSPYTSSTHYFIYNSTNDAPSAPQLLSPLHGTVATQSTSLSFTATDADSLGLTPDVLTYNVEISLNNTFTSIVSTTIGATSGILLSQVNNSGVLVNNQTYYWRVYAKDNHGSLSAASSTQSFKYQISNTAPTATAFLSVPSDSIYRMTSILQWMVSTDIDVGNTVSYQIEGAYDTTAGLSIQVDVANTSTSLGNLISANTVGSVDSADFDNKRIFLRIRSRDNNGLSSSYSEWKKVKWNTISLDTVNLSSVNKLPISNSSIQTRQPLLDWDNLSNHGGVPSSYSVEIASSNDFNASDLYSVVASEFNYATNGISLTDNAKYYWRVKARDDFGDSTVSSVDSFYVNVINESPSLPLPFNITNGTERRWVDSLGWTASDLDPLDTLTFNLRVSPVADFSLNVIAVNGLTKSKYRLSDLTGSENLAENGRYYWAVQSRDKAGLLSAYTSPDSFFFFNNVNEAPTQPAQLLPEEGAVIVSTSTFHFSSTDVDAIGNSPDQIVYTLQVARDVAFNAIISTTSGITVDSVSVSALQNKNLLQSDSTYYWRVWATDLHGLSSDTTQIRSFLFVQSNSAPSSFTWISPSNNGVLEATTLLRWSRSIDADGNALQYLVEARSDTLGAPNRIVAVGSDTSYTFESLLSHDTLGASLEDQEDRVLFFRVHAKDPYGARSPYSPWRRLIVNQVDAIPTAINLIRPQWNDTLLDESGVSWEPSMQGDPMDNVLYTIQIAEDSVFTQVKASTSLTQIDTSVSLTKLTGSQWLVPGQSYFVRVRSMDLQGQSAGWCVPVRFVLATQNQRPTKPGILFPKNNQVLNPLNLLAWNGSTDADGSSVQYEILLSLASSPAPKDSTEALYWKRGIVNTDLDARWIQGYNQWVDSTMYRWTIRSYDSSLYHSPSDSAFFRFVSTAPSAPELLKPNDSTVALPTDSLTWAAAQDLDAGPLDTLRYIIEIDTSENFKTLLSLDTVKGESVLLMYLNHQADFKNNDTLVWRVRALDNHGKWGQYSTPHSFIFNRGNEAPFAPIVVGLQEDSLLYSFQSFHWKGLDPNEKDIVDLKYRLQVSRSSGFASLLLDSSGIDTTDFRLDQSATLLSKLKTSETYYWRVLATDTGGLQSPWSQTIKWQLRKWNSKDLDIQVVSGKGAVLLPEDSLIWRKPKYDAVHYEFVVTSADSSLQDTFLLPGSIMDSLSQNGIALSDMENLLGTKFSTATFAWWKVRAVDTLYGLVGSYSPSSYFFVGDTARLDSKQSSSAWIVENSKMSLWSADSNLILYLPDSAFASLTGLVVRELPDTLDKEQMDLSMQKLVLSADTAKRYLNADRNLRALGQKVFIIEAHDLKTSKPVQPATGRVIVMSYMPQYLDTANGEVFVRYTIPSKGKIKKTQDYSLQNLALFRLDESQKRWARQVESRVEYTEPLLGKSSVGFIPDYSPRISLETSHFSVYTLMAANPTTEPFSDFLVYPSPVQLSSPQEVLNQARISYQISGATRIEIAIYSRTGGLVWSKEFNDVPNGGAKNEVLWDGRNQNGSLVGNGYYVVHLTAKPTTGGKYHVKQMIAVYK